MSITTMFELETTNASPLRAVYHVLLSRPPPNLRQEQNNDRNDKINNKKIIMLYYNKTKSMKRGTV